MILLTLFQLTILFEVLFFVIWAFPNWANQGIASDDATTNGKLLIPEAKNGSCHAQDKCGVCRDTTNEGGTIELAADLNCLFKIQAPSGAEIQLTFTEFDGEKCCDFVTVSDGENNLLKMRLNGNNDIPEVITSSSGQIKVEFVIESNSTLPLNSTSNVEPTRWQAKYKFLLNDTNFVSQLDAVNLTNLSSNNV